MKTAIIYYSKHHSNTKQLLDKLCEDNDITLINAINTPTENLNDFDLIGFASGIYYSKFHKSVIKFIENNLPEDKKVFFICTYGVKKDGYTDAVKKAVNKKNTKILGEFGCLGFNTFGPFKLIGGIAKGHPNNEDFKNVKDFFKNIIA